MTSRQDLVLFAAAACGFSWGLLALSRALDPSGSVTAVLLPYGLGPLAASLWWLRRHGLAPGTLLGGEPFPNRWFLVAWLLGPAVAMGSMLVAPLFPGVELTTDLLRIVATKVTDPAQLEEVRKNYAGVSAGLFVAAQVVPAMLFGVTVGAAVALAEEVGWRVVLPRLLAPAGFWKTALVTGLCRGLWALPLALAGYPYDAHPREGAFVGLGWALLVGILATFMRAVGGSVLPAAMLVGSLTSGAAVSNLLLVGGNDLTTRATGLPGLVVLAVAVVVVVLPRWRRADAVLRSGSLPSGPSRVS
jgi:hypothetical protein